MINISIVEAPNYVVNIYDLRYTLYERPLNKSTLDDKLPTCYFKVTTRTPMPIKENDFLYLASMAKAKKSVKIIINAAGLGIIFNKFTIQKEQDNTFMFSGEDYEWTLP